MLLSFKGARAGVYHFEKHPPTDVGFLFAKKKRVYQIEGGAE
jgi:hypothetical protein